MNQVFVLNASAVYSHDGDAAVTALANVADLADGSPAFFQEDGVKVLDSGAFVKSNQYAKLYMGRGVELPQSSNRINMSTLTAKKQAYVAPVAKIAWVGYNGTSGSMNLNSTSKQGSIYGIAFVDLTIPVEQRRRHTIDEVTIVDNITVASAVSTLVAKINANPAIAATGVVASAQGTTGIKFTGVAGKNFSVQGVGLLESADTSDDGNFTTGANTYEWAKELEYNESTVEGRSSALESAPDDGFKLPARVAAGQSYTVYNLGWEWLREGYGSANANPNTHEVTLLVPAANTTVIASLDKVLADITPAGVVADVEARIATLESA